MPESEPIVSASTDQILRDKVEEWRENARRSSLNAENDRIPALDRRQCRGVSQAYQQCADELDALLKAPPSSGPPAETKGHRDPDCEVMRGVGWMCTCSTPEEKAEDATYRAEVEAERDAQSVASPLPSVPAWETPRRLIEVTSGGGIAPIIGVYDVDSMSPDTLARERTKGNREFIYARDYDKAMAAVDRARACSEAAHAQEIAGLHALIADFDAVTNPEHFPDLHDRAAFWLGAERGTCGNAICQRVTALEAEIARLTTERNSGE